MTSTKERIVIASAELFMRQGYTGTGLKQVTAEAQAPFGSLYHFFPGGKEQLADEVLRQGGAFFLALFKAIADAAPDVLEGVRDFFAGAGETLVSTDYADACPIATVALEVASTNDRLRETTHEIFESWLAELEARLVAAGVAQPDARPLALVVLAQLEGAFLLCRAARSTEAMDAAGAAAVEAVRRALPAPAAA